MPTESPENRGEQNESEKGISFTRRDLLMMFAGCAASFLALRYGRYLIPPDDHDKHKKEKKRGTEKGYEEEKSLLEKKYSCEINLKNSEHKVKALKVLRKALSKYPPDLIKRLKLTIFFQEPDSDFIASCDGSDYAVEKGEADLDDGILIIDIAEEVIHHELYHIIRPPQFFSDRFLESDKEEKSPENINWVNLNPKKEKAYVKDEDVCGAMTTEITSKEGFIMPSSAYAKKSPEEDRAMIMGYLLTKYESVMKLADKDKVLADKIMELKEDYSKYSERKMNYQYWEDLKSGKINEEYWDK